ncbi:proton-conducting transporter transmembrane domain-containing protein [Halocola ammonii]
MSQSLYALIPAISPVLFAVAAIFSWFQSGLRPTALKKMLTGVAIAGVVVSLSSALLLLKSDSLEFALPILEELGFSIRVDSLSILFLSMIALLSLVVVRFSMNYLDGDNRQGVFLGRLAATIASVQLFVLSGGLAMLVLSWVTTSLTLHRLLVFYADRPGAIVASRKKFVMARLSDLSLMSAAFILYSQFNSANLQTIFDGLAAYYTGSVSNSTLNAATFLLVMAAFFKSAQFPTHGWLVEIMETPTPVSALLHAGLLNAGPFLIIRFAPLMEVGQAASLTLVILGGFTAIFGSAVYMTQTSVKTALGYSSIAHMGFSLLLCGLGLYPAALLHLVAHSFYKAHSFLSSGSVIDSLQLLKMGSIKKENSLGKTSLALVISAAAYFLIATLWGVDLTRDPALVVVGGIIILGLTNMLISAMETVGRGTLILRSSLFSVLVALAFFSFESLFHWIIVAQIPLSVDPTTADWLAIAGVLLAFGAVIIVQIIAPGLRSDQKYQSFYTHLRNGFYANSYLDRLVGGINVKGNNSARSGQYEFSKSPNLQKSAGLSPHFKVHRKIISYDKH